MLQVIINYNMSVLGQLEGLSGHLSPLAAYCQTRDRVLLMDVWWETRPVWVELSDLWVAMDTLDPAIKEKVGEGGLYSGDFTVGYFSERVRVGEFQEVVR